MKALNVKGIGILAGILVVIHFATGLILTPLLSKPIIEAINKNTSTKISIKSVSVWPLTLGVSLKELKVFDPDDTNKKMVEIPKASIRLSLIGILRKQIAIAKISLSGAIINLEGEPDGSFNIQKIAPPRDEKSGEDAKGPSLIERLKGKKDFFSRIIEMVKSEPSKKSEEKDKKEENKIEMSVVELPRGRRVKFTPKKGYYLFSIGSIAIRNSTIKITQGSRGSVDIVNGNIVLRGLGIDPSKGVKIDRLSVKGSFEKDGKGAGDFSFFYDKKGDKTKINVKTKDVDLSSMGFLFKDSIPIAIKNGLLTLDSRTGVEPSRFDSKNSLTIKGGIFGPKKTIPFSLGALSIPIVCKALNQIDPLVLKFNIGGTPDKPEFSGLTDTIKEVIKPYMGQGIVDKGKDILKGLVNNESEGGASVEGTAEDTTKKAIDTIKKLFQ